MAMRKHFQEMLEEIERRLADEAGHVDRALDSAARALRERDGSLAGKVVEGDRVLDFAEVELERLCLDTLALQQPLATDLRFLAGALKINNDLERMGDLACNIAKQTWRLGAPPVPEFADPFAEMTDTVRKMVRESVDALIRRDPNLAREVWQSDTRADERLREMLDLCLRLIKTGRASVEDATIYVSAARAMERVGDHATNIAEDVVFIVEGRIVRHNVEARIAPAPPEGV